MDSATLWKFYMISIVRFFCPSFIIFVKKMHISISQISAWWKYDSPGFMKSDKPKSVALRGESSLVDLKRKFYRQETKDPFSRSMILHIHVIHKIKLVIPQVSCHGELSHADDIQLQLSASVALLLLHLSQYNDCLSWFNKIKQW